MAIPEIVNTVPTSGGGGGGGIGASLKGASGKVGGFMEKAGGWMEKNPMATKIGMAGIGAIGKGIQSRRAAGGGGGAMGGGAMGGGRPDVDPNYMQYLNDIRRRRLAYQSGQAYAPERASLLKAFSTGAREIRRTGGGTGATIYGLRRMMAGVGAGLAQVKQQVGAPMEAKLAEMEGQTVQDITGRAMELDLLRQSKGEAQGAAAQTRGAISGSDPSSGMKGLFTAENIKGMGKMLSDLSKKRQQKTEGADDEDIRQADEEITEENINEEQNIGAEDIPPPVGS